MTALSEGPENERSEIPKRARFGFVYILANPCMPGIVKIGQSERHPGVRAAEMSAHEGVPLPFHVVFFCEVADRVEAEQVVHSAMARCRVSLDREFFRIGAEEAQKFVESLLHIPAFPAPSSAGVAMLRASKCPECGGPMRQHPDAFLPKCDWCGAVFAVPSQEQ